MKSKHIFPLVLIMVMIVVTGCDKRAYRLAYLVGSPSLNGYYSIESDSVTMYASPRDKAAGRIECRVYEEEYPVFVRMFRVLGEEEAYSVYRKKGKNRFTEKFRKRVMSAPYRPFVPGTSKDKPLQGMRIALDPGHIAGSLKEGIKEGKFVILYGKNGKIYKFYEADLNLKTARLLKKMLEEKGARVLLSREKGGSVTGLTFAQWLRSKKTSSIKEKLRDGLITREKANGLLKTRNTRRLFKFFLREVDRPFRAKKINAFHPHLTVVIHYNTAGDSSSYRHKYMRIREIMKSRRMGRYKKMREVQKVISSISQTDLNYCVVFAPGSFAKNELLDPRSRMEFMRLIVSPDLENSISFSTYILHQFVNLLKVPPVKDSYNKSRFNILTDTRGVYVRNLRMTRLVWGPVCLGEPLIQNNINEAKDLAVSMKGKVPGRVKKTAQTYFNAIMRYMKSMKEGEIIQDP